MFIWVVLCRCNLSKFGQYVLNLCFWFLPTFRCIKMAIVHDIAEGKSFLSFLLFFGLLITHHFVVEFTDKKQRE